MQFRPLAWALGVVLLACSGSKRNDPAAGDEDAAVACQPTVQMVSGVSDHVSNLEVCGGSWVRRGPADCLPEPSPEACSDPDEGNECNVDADCTARRDGACVDGPAGCHCAYACKTDADCGAKEACACPAGLPVEGGGYYGLSVDNTCLPAQCRSADDCGGRECMVAKTCCGATAFFCQTVRDTCRSDADCEAEGGQCAFNEAARRWECQEECDCQ